jgi:hypothetical protein
MKSIHKIKTVRGNLRTSGNTARWMNDNYKIFLLTVLLLHKIFVKMEIKFKDEHK